MGNHDVWEDERLEDQHRERERWEKDIKQVLGIVEEWLRKPWNRGIDLKLSRAGGKVKILEEKQLVEVLTKLF